MHVELEARAEVDREAVQIAGEPVVGVGVDEEPPDVADARLEPETTAGEEELPRAVVGGEQLHAEAELDREHVDDPEARSQGAGDPGLEAEIVALEVGELSADQTFAAKLDTLELRRRGGGRAEGEGGDHESQDPCHGRHVKHGARHPG